MRSPRTRLALTVALTLVLAIPARATAGRDVVAGFPPVIITSPTHIALVGADTFGNPDSAGTFTVRARDTANQPVPGVVIVVNFYTAIDFRLCDHQPAGIVWTSSHQPAAITDARGLATFTLLGCASNRVPTPELERASLYADGIPVGTVAVSAYDLESCNGVGVGDLATFGADFTSGANLPRSDYDGDGVVGAGDLSLWARVFLRAGSYFNCPAAPAAPR